MTSLMYSYQPRIWVISPNLPSLTFTLIEWGSKARKRVGQVPQPTWQLGNLDDCWILWHFQAVVGAKVKAYSEHEVKLWMQRGNEKIKESELTSHSIMLDPRMDITSREVAIQLGEGETLGLVMEATDDVDEVNYLTFCVSSLALE